MIESTSTAGRRRENSTGFLRRTARTLRAWAPLLALLPFLLQFQNSKDSTEQERLLEVRLRQVDVKAARSELFRLQTLFDQGLISSRDIEKATVDLETAELQYQIAVLSLLNLQPRLSVQRAVKIKNPDGTKSVRLTVSNLSATFDDSQLKLLNGEVGEGIPPELRRRNIRDIYISLRDAGEEIPGTESGRRGTTIGLPYEIHVPELKYGESQTLDFQLLRDVNSVVVVSSYLGADWQVDLQLEQGALENVVAVAATQISQEADLASDTTFQLRVERSSLDNRSYLLKTVNLPKAINAQFTDSSSQARLSQVNFPVGNTLQSLNLVLSMPSVAGEGITIDSPVPFWVVVMEQSQAKLFEADRQYSREEIEASRVGRIQLEVTPRGLGRITVSAESLYSEIQPNQEVRSQLTVKNVGTREINNVEFEIDPPPNWRAAVEPTLLQSLAVSQREPVNLTITPPAQLAAGDYEIRIKTKATAFNRPVPSEDKIYRVSVKVPQSLGTTLTLLLVLTVVVAGIVVFGVRLARR